MAKAQDLCTTATPLPVSGTCVNTLGTNTGATASGELPDPSCGSFSTGEDTWFSITVPASGEIDITASTAGGPTDWAMSVYSGACGALAEVECDDDDGPGLFPLISLTGQTAGDVLLVRVWEWGNNATGDFNICAVDPAAAPPPVIPANNDCASATVLPVEAGTACTAQTLGTNVNATASGELPDPACGNFATGEDVWFSVTVPAGGELNIEASTAGGPTDWAMSVYSGACGALAEIECDDDDGPGLFPSISLTGQTPGDVLLVRVWEWGNNAEGEFNICAFAPAPPPPPSLPINFDDPVDYNLQPFGAETSAVLGADPTDPANQVLCVTKLPGADCWAGTTIGGGDGCLADPIAFAPGTTTINVDVYSPVAGAPILVKVEDCADPTISSEIIVQTTAANTWETLSFDLSNGCAAAPDFANTYNKISVFPNFTCDPDLCGVANPGAGSPFSTDAYYFDNIMLVANPPVGITCTGNVPIENLANGMDYTITSDAMGNVMVTVTVVDNPAGLVGFFGGPGGIFQVADATGTFVYNFTGQTVGAPFNVDMFFNWAAGGQGNSDQVAITVNGPCSAGPPPVTCTGNVPIENLPNGMDYTIVSDANGNVDITVTVVDNPAGLVGFLGGPGGIFQVADATGTFVYNLTGQMVGAPYVLDMFFNWAAGGQGNSETVTITVNGPCMAANTDVEFCVDFSCFPGGPVNPSVFGNFTDPPFNPNINLLTDMGGGIWCTTVSIPPGNYEFLFFEQNEGAETFAGGEPCTVSNFGFTNRTLTVGGTSPQAVSFGWESCDQDCIAPVPAPEIPITFDDPDVDYNLSDFGGASSVIGADPTDPSNPVLCITKPPGSQCWAGTTVGGNPTCLQNPIQFSAGNMILSMDVYSPVAGAPILLKVENCINGGISSEIIAFTTLSNGWETLAFDFSMGCANPVDLTQTYDQISVFPNFTCDPDACGAPNPGAGSAFSTSAFYFDNIMFCDQSLAPVITCPADATISCDESTDPANTGMATATDLCSEPTVTFADVSTQGTGCDAYNYTITRTWTATDNLGLTATCAQVITVQDITPPMITCPGDVTTSCDEPTNTGATGMATATDNCSAEGEITITFVDASTQEMGTGCGASTFSITRTWTATDACGNTAQCDQIIGVADTEGPVITCPPNQTLACDTDPFPIAATIDDFIALGGTASDNCGSVSDFTLTVSDDPPAQSMLDFCPSSPVADRTLTRTYTVTDACGNSSTCEQLFIYDPSTNGPVITSIPLDQTVDCAVNAFPQLGLFTAEGDCSGITYSVSGPNSSGTTGCPGSTIQYTYTATDVCGRFATHVQTYTLTNDGPEFVCPPDICVIECPSDTDMIQAQFDSYSELATVISSCSESSISISNNFNPNSFIPQNCMNPTVAVPGAVAYQVVRFTATDACGRNGTCTALVVLQDTDGPVMDSGSGVTFGLADCSDANLQQGYTDWATSQLNGLSASDECSDGTVSFSYTPLSPNTDCSSGLASTEVSFIATDACGNETILTTYYRIIDNSTGEPVMATVSGTLQTEEDEMVALANVDVNGYMNGQMMTNEDGYYHFDLMMAQNYSIAPSRNDDPLNGITTYDMILLGQHLLEINLLDSPYKMIAADVNESGEITVTDMIELRRLILLIDNEFSSGKSWTFVDAAYVFPNPSNPFATTFPTSANINNLTSSQIIDFIGIKLGDLNASANVNALQAGDTRSSDGSLNIKLEDQDLKAGQIYELEFKASDFKEVAGFQFTLDFSDDHMKLVDYQGSKLESMSSSNFGFTKAKDGKISVSWNEYLPVNLADDETLFQLSFEAVQDGKLSELVSINSSMIAQEAYQAELRKDVELKFGNSDLAQNEFRLLQNRPNPFKQETIIGFQLPELTETTLTVYDISGRILFTQKKPYEAGIHQVSLDASDLGSTGVLYYQLSTPVHTDTKKMIILK